MFRLISVLSSILLCLFLVERAGAQRGATPIQPGTPIERELGRGMIDRFTVTLDQDQFMQIVVDQRGIDVVVRVLGPGRQGFVEYDTPNGNQGPENISLIGIKAGTYFIDVAPLSQGEDVPPGRYEIKIVEVRQATEQELQSGKNEEVLRARGIKLLNEMAETLQQIHLPQTRVRVQLTAARLLWDTDEKTAAKLVADAMEGVREYMAKVDSGDQEYYQGYSEVMQLRQEVLQVLGPHDPELALTFLRSTRTLISPDTGPNNGQLAQELSFELSLASQITSKDPKRALQIAEDTLKSGYSSALTDALNRLRGSEPELAAKLAKEIAAKLQNEKLLNNQEAANVAINLLQIARFPPKDFQVSSGTAQSRVELLSDQEYRDLFSKALADGLSYSAPASNVYTPERNVAQSILNSMQQMTAEMNSYAPASVAVVEKKTSEINNPPDPQSRAWQKYQEAINNGTTDAAMEAVGQAPRQMRDQLYQQISGKAAASGDLARARQILMDHIVNPMQRQQLLNNLEQQAIYNAIGKGKVDEALRGLANLRSAKERANMLAQIVVQIGPGQKRAAALSYLEQARSLLGASAQAEDQEHMNALLQVAVAFARYDAKRAFEVVEPLLDQFNEMSTAAVALNGFGQQFFQDDELIMQNGNGLANTANQLILTLSILAATNFERAKVDCERLQRPEVRIGGLLAIAQQAMYPAGSAVTRVVYRR